MESVRIITKSAAETKKVAKLLAREIARRKDKKAFVVALSGNLGAGKTTFTQGFAEALGVRERVLSPTFVLMKTYALTKNNVSKKHLDPVQNLVVPILKMQVFERKTSRSTKRNSITVSVRRSLVAKNLAFSGRGKILNRFLVHIDCYRIKHVHEIAHIGFKDLLKDNDAIILIEWAERIKKLLPKGTLWIKFSYRKKSNERRIVFGQYANIL